MDTIAFWKSWPLVYQRLFWSCVALLALAQAFLWISDFRSPEPVFTKAHFQLLEAQNVPVQTFRIGITQLTVTSENYLIFERVLGGPLHPNGIAPYFFLGLLLSGTVILLTIITTLTRFWFSLGMGLFILLIISLRLESLQVFGLTNKIPSVIVLLIFGLSGYYFKYVRPATHFATRMAAFLVITLATGVGLVLFARANLPLSYLPANALIAGTVFSILFIFTVAHEILATFVYVVTRGTKQTKSLRHFLIISAIYLVNLGLIYADKKHLIEWDFFPFSLFLLLTISGILGLWGFRQREPLYASIIPANPFGVFLYMALAGICFGTVGYFLATANDPAIQILQDAVLYSHLGYGIVFVAYIISNFVSMLASNMQVHKVLYKPTVMPYFTFRFAGLIATFTFFAYSNWKVSVNQVYAGYYNEMGDLYLSRDTLSLAKGYYQRSIFYATRNYHAHYALAEIDALQDGYEKEKQEYQQLVDGRPLDLAYLNLSELYERDNSMLEAALVLDQGLKDFPKNGLLQNALSLAYARLNLKDSALLLANLARNSRVSKAEAETNLIGLIAKFGLRHPADSLMAVLNPDNPGVKTNGLALATLQKEPIYINVDPGSDTLLTVHSATALNNHLLNHLDDVDTALVSHVVSLARRPSNSFAKSFLLSAAAHAYYRDGRTAQAIQLMSEIAFLGQQGKYYNVLGLWALEQGAYTNAIHFFDEANRQNYPASLFNRAVALTEAGDFTNGFLAWDSLQRSPDSVIQAHARKMIEVLSVSTQQALLLNDEEKYEYARHGFTLDDEESFETFISIISDQELRARAIVDRSKKWDEADETGLAMQTLAMTKGLQLRDPSLYEEILHLNLRFLAKQKQWPLLTQQMNTEIHYDGKYRQDRIYFDALLSEQAGKNEDAEKKFTWLAGANPFFEDAVIAAFEFLNPKSADKLKTYSILVNALELNPNSVKLLKAFIVQAGRLGFSDYAKSSVDQLRTLLSSKAFSRFIEENPEIAEVKRD